MKVFKTIMLYLLLLIGLGIASVLICCVLMICSPKTVIFGYKYVSYKDAIEFTIDSSELSGVSALSITSNRMDIHIIPNSESNDIEVMYSQGMSGFVKENACDLTVKHEKRDNTFDSGDSLYAQDIVYKTMNIDVTEPEGLVFLSDSNIKVYVPSHITFTVINASTQNGKIQYSSTAEGKTIRVSNLYLDSQMSGGNAIAISKPNASRYHLKTNSGACHLVNDGADISGNIIFATSGGKLVAKDGAIKGDLTVKSREGVSGANIDITNLYGDLNFYAKSGNVSIEKITCGPNSTYPIVDIQSKYCAFKVDTLVGTITTQGFEGENIDNIDISINNLTYVTALARPIDINTKAGNVSIKNLRGGQANITTSTGNIYVEKSFVNMTVETYDGKIDIHFDNTNASLLTRLDINVLKKSAITLTGLKGTINITMTEDGDRKISLGFHPSILDGSSVCEIGIYASGNNVVLEDISSANFAVYTDGEVKHDVIIADRIMQGDFDYDNIHSMDNQYRFNYSSNPFRYSKIYVHNNDYGTVTVNSLG